MTKKQKAIRVIERLKSELAEFEPALSTPWIAEARNYLEIILGPENLASKYLEALDRSMGTTLDDKKQKAVEILNGAIRIVRDYGVYKPKKTNFIYRIDSGWASLILASLGGVVFSVGFALGRIDAIFGIREHLPF